MEQLQIEINRERIYTRCNEQLNLLGSVMGSTTDTEIMMHSHGRKWFDEVFAAALHTVVGSLRRLAGQVNGDSFSDLDGVITLRVIPTCGEQVLRLKPAIESYMIAYIVERWGLGRIAIIDPMAAANALSELRHVTLICSHRDGSIL